MGKSKKVSRRGFLTQSTRLALAGVAAPCIIPSGVLASAGEPGANDRIGIGFIGVGRRAQQLMGLPKGAEIVAISDVHQQRLDEVAKGKKYRTYKDYRKMLESSDVDAVIIATPDHWHALNSIHACQAGKDVYCEKPMSLTIREGRAMVEAVRKHKRIFQTGSQQRSMDACRFGCELVRNGRIGKIHTVHADNYPSPWECDLPPQPVPDGLDWDMWLGQTPLRPYHIDIYLPRAKPGWISFRPWSGGEMTGWGAHGLDLIQWALGMDESGPVELWPEGEGLKCPVTFRYANGIVVKLDGKGPHGGGLFVGDKGEIMIDRGKYKTTPDALAKDPLKDSDIHLYKSNDHMRNWVDCIRSRQLPIADVEIGHRSTAMCHLGNIARWAGRKLQWDPVKERFVGDEEANKFVERPMRAPWTL
jgi:predicted dehydrogenase